MTNLIAGIDIGGTKIALALAAPNCEIVCRATVPTLVEQGAARIFDRMLARLEEMREQQNAQISKIGVGCAGPLDLKRGVAVSPPNLPGWNDFPIVQTIRERFGAPVVLDNDANVAALAEQRFGAGKNLQNLIYITVSTGIGGGVIADNRLLHGLTGNAGEVGHIVVMPGGVECGCGARGCLEAVCSGTGIARRFRARIETGAKSVLTEKFENISQITAKHIAEAAAANDCLASEIWDETVFYLARGVGNIIVMFEPEAVILGGGVAQTGDLLFKPLRELVKNQIKIFSTENIKILPAGLGADSGIYGALALVAD